MISIGQFFRLIKIQRVLIKHGLDEIVLATNFLRPVRFLLYLLPWNWRRRDYAPRSERILHALEDLGPIFVKFGQLLSTRRDLLPEDLADAFSKLQDSVPPFSGSEAKKIIEHAFGQSVDVIFKNFEEQPLASASIAQVHSATLNDGREVVVKVVRPGIEKTIRRDMGIVMVLAEFAEKYWSHGKRLRPVGVVEEYRKILLDELDLMREASNASQLKRNFEGDPRLHIPAIEWDLARTNVLVMERVNGLRVDDQDGLIAAGVSMKELAEIGVDIFFTQVFRDRYFHADMHPGNLFVIPATNDQPLKIALVDFGIMGSLNEEDQHYLADNFMAFLRRDYKKVAELHVESGWVPAGTRVDDFEFAIRSVCEPIFEKPLKEISFGRLLLRLFQTAQRYNMKILPQLILLQKTLVNVEGLGRQLYPELDIWHTARPTMEQWMKERVGFKRILNASKENIPTWIERLPELPGDALHVLDQMKTGNLQIKGDTEKLEAIHRAVEQSSERSARAILGAGLIISAAILLGLNGGGLVNILGIPIFAWCFLVMGAILMLTALKKS